jgi:hypothetical protein
MNPLFKAGRFDDGFTAAVDALIMAVKGEFTADDVQSAYSAGDAEGLRFGFMVLLRFFGVFALTKLFLPLGMLAGMAGMPLVFHFFEQPLGGIVETGALAAVGFFLALFSRLIAVYGKSSAAVIRQLERWQFGRLSSGFRRIQFRGGFSGGRRQFWWRRRLGRLVMKNSSHFFSVPNGKRLKTVSRIGSVKHPASLLSWWLIAARVMPMLPERLPRLLLCRYLPQ